MKYCIPFFLFICLILNFKKAEAQQDPALTKFYDDKLKANGVVAPAELLVLPYQDIEKVANFNFDEYREYSIHKKVKLERGPQVELLSLQEMIALGHNVSPSIVLRKKDTVLSNGTHYVMPLINTGIGVRIAKTIGEKQ